MLLWSAYALAGSAVGQLAPQVLILLLELLAHFAPLMLRRPGLQLLDLLFVPLLLCFDQVSVQLGLVVQLLLVVLPRSVVAFVILLPILLDELRDLGDVLLVLLLVALLLP